ncbi:MAG TPA: tetratricopeptide repeat protein [Rhizomicrobium sp.]|nr:tetratricopeptide repeat protein [Rhizomicrobium sp.]
MPRPVLSLAALLLCSTALCGCGTFGGADSLSGAHTDRTALEKQMQQNPPSDVAGGVREAHALRLAGKYDEASRILSQLMLVASDDPQVVGEYGKTLLQRRKLDDAVAFLTRATQLKSDDWTTYSALGVSYDQLGNQAAAKIAYEQALALNPNDPSVLSNYALSRMLANDLDSAHALAQRARAAGGAADPKIARDIAMIEAAASKPALAAAEPTPQPVASATPAPSKPVASAASATKPVLAALPPAPKVGPAAVSSTPRRLADTLPGGTQPWSGVVMQPVPVDPLAGPVRLKPPVAHARLAATPADIKASRVKDASVAGTVKTAAAKPAHSAVPVKAAAVSPAKPVADKAPASLKPVAAASGDGVPALRLAADASTP